MLDTGLIEKNGVQTKQEYIKNILEMSGLAQIYHFELFVLLQPNLFTTKCNFTDKDIVLAKEYCKKEYPKIETAFEIGYPKLIEAINELRNHGIKAYNLSDIFCNKKDNIFLDYCHVNSKGNRIIVDNMVKIIDKGNYK